jgi:hypothetical protein
MELKVNDKLRSGGHEATIVKIEDGMVYAELGGEVKPAPIETVVAAIEAGQFTLIADEAEAEDVQIQTANAIVESLKADGRFEANLWNKSDKVRVYVDDYGYIAIGKDGTAYPSLSRYQGNIRQAAGL